VWARGARASAKTEEEGRVISSEEAALVFLWIRGLESGGHLTVQASLLLDIGVALLALFENLDDRHKQDAECC
jgi:hypothetical protein